MALHVIQAQGNTLVTVVSFVFLLTLVTATEVELNNLEIEQEEMFIIGNY